MASDITFEPEAEDDLSEAIDYLHPSSPAAKRFSEAIDRSIGRILEFPESGTPVDGNARSVYVSGTFYSIVYELQGRAVNILAFAHASRDPDYWRSRRR